MGLDISDAFESIGNALGFGDRSNNEDMATEDQRQGTSAYARSVSASAGHGKDNGFNTISEWLDDD